MTIVSFSNEYYNPARSSDVADPGWELSYNSPSGMDQPDSDIDLPLGKFALTMGLVASESALIATYIDSPDKLGDPYVAGAATAALGVATVKSAINYVRQLVSI